MTTYIFQLSSMYLKLSSCLTENTAFIFWKQNIEQNTSRVFCESYETNTRWTKCRDFSIKAAGNDSTDSNLAWSLL